MFFGSAGDNLSELKASRLPADAMRVSRPLPDPPVTLAGAPRAFYDELLEMLALVAPSKLDVDATQVAFDRGGVRVDLGHADREDWSVWAMVDEHDGIAGAASVHEHFSAPHDGVDEERPWTMQIVDFLAELLRGEIEIETTFRGNAVVKVEHYNRDEAGERALLGHTGFLTPGRLFVWRPRRTETERISFT